MSFSRIGLSSKLSLKEIERYLQVDSLRYLSLKGMLAINALPDTRFCDSCFSGKYPIKPPTINGKERLALKRSRSA